MKTILSIMLLGLPVVASADYLDVIEFRLNDGCRLENRLQLMRDFNTQWGAKNGYQAVILTPVQGPNHASLFWVCRTRYAATFGKAWDAWSNYPVSCNAISRSRG